MSKRETPMTRWYWQRIGGILIEEFCVVSRGCNCGERRLDGVIVKDAETRIAAPGEKVPLEGKDLIVVQTKAERLGMYLMGQVFFSAQLIQRWKPRSVVSVALVAKDDEELRPLILQYPGMEVIVCPAEFVPLKPTRKRRRLIE